MNDEGCDQNIRNVQCTQPQWQRESVGEYTSSSREPFQHTTTLHQLDASFIHPSRYDGIHIYVTNWGLFH